jgi:hypothetical protein
MKILICGSRTFKNYDFLKEICTNIISKIQYDQVIPNKELEIVSGAANGADKTGEKFARENGIAVVKFPAHWDDMTEQPLFPKIDVYGKPYNAFAGTNRNTRMIEYLANNGGGVVIAFDEKTGKGTADTVRKAKVVGLDVYNINCKNIDKVKTKFIQGTLNIKEME